MSPATAQQLLARDAGMSQDTKVVLALTKHLCLQQDKVGKKATQHRGNITHER